MCSIRYCNIQIAAPNTNFYNTSYEHMVLSHDGVILPLIIYYFYYLLLLLLLLLAHNIQLN